MWAALMTDRLNKSSEKTVSDRLSIHQAMIYVFAFLNPLFLPFGLLYTHIYAPIGLYYVCKWSNKAVIFLSLLIFFAFAYTASIVLSKRDIQYVDYLSSFLVLFASLIFSVYIYAYIALRISNFDKLIKKIIKLNVIACVIAAILLIVGIGDLLWTTQGPEEKSNRLQLFFYEPSIYALVYAPFVTYAITKYIERQSVHRIYWLIIAIIPLLLSGSAGVMGALSLAIILGNFRSVLKVLYRKWMAILIIITICIAALPSLGTRYQAVIAGEDNSGSVRVVYSLVVAANMLNEKNLWLIGVGPGQLKYLIGDYTSEIAGFGGDRLPNSIASTIATVGIIGILIKLLIMLILYIKTKSYNYNYSRTLFLFVFIYQFTGGYFNNVNEYVALAFAFGYSSYKQRQSRLLPEKYHNG